LLLLSSCMCIHGYVLFGRGVRRWVSTGRIATCRLSGRSAAVWGRIFDCFELSMGLWAAPRPAHLGGIRHAARIRPD